MDCIVIVLWLLIHSELGISIVNGHVKKFITPIFLTWWIGVYGIIKISGPETKHYIYFVEGCEKGILTIFLIRHFQVVNFLKNWFWTLIFFVKIEGNLIFLWNEFLVHGLKILILRILIFLITLLLVYFMLIKSPNLLILYWMKLVFQIEILIILLLKKSLFIFLYSFPFLLLFLELIFSSLFVDKFWT